MAGINISVTPDLSGARRLAELSAEDLETLVFAIGELMVTQTKTRIADEKTDPDGAPWAPWSDAYAATRSARHSLLVDVGNPGLLESIANHSTADAAIVGTNLVYGRVHQVGSDDGAIPARPYLGLSGENRREIEALVVDGLEGMLQ
ncbi:phage virion morphogenesis protein [Paracoccus sediminis]|uniref:Phage virion morphogenesis (Putative tail completion) protein n=1 Tax=Paracoccus sediminis TaxID=1214787 RepID=A0A238UML2_9RHOB|nr:phage virion morphogenesis protein [Paracoccus sediminis]TBN53135.1 phage virion morphogenesis protein [Paracoccus sediminis]SNR22887.1 phage virion morphogenesis (putative tail completion) protein [Paracoccus sediminis]